MKKRLAWRPVFTGKDDTKNNTVERCPAFLHRSDAESLARELGTKVERVVVISSEGLK